MAYLETIPLVAGDDLPELNFTLRDSNTAAPGERLDPDDPTSWAPIDLTGQIVRVYFRPLGGGAEPHMMICTLHAPYSEGRCSMQWNATTLDVPAGSYEAEIEIEDVVGRKQTIFDRLKFKVRDDF